VGELDVVFDDNFQTDQGWTVTNSPGLTDGAWQRTTPDPGRRRPRRRPRVRLRRLGFCYITDNGADNSDVDGGSTTLTSPDFAVAGSPEAVISYARWFDNNEGGSAANAVHRDLRHPDLQQRRRLVVGLETVGPTGPEVSGGWIEKSFRIADFVTPTDQVRVRFIASDDTGTVVEAGVDAVSVSGLTCENPTGGACNAADLAEPFGVLDLADINAFVAASRARTRSRTSPRPFGVFDLADINAFVAAFNGRLPVSTRGASRRSQGGRATAPLFRARLRPPVPPARLRRGEPRQLDRLREPLRVARAEQRLVAPATRPRSTCTPRSPETFITRWYRGLIRQPHPPDASGLYRIASAERIAPIGTRRPGNGR
jgi:hypothetical protein